MIIAVAYSDGQVFPHFGKTQEFKYYSVKNGEIESSEILGTDGEGHEALAGLLANNNVDLVLCGGLGEGAANALADAGINVISGVSGDADQAVTDFLLGKLESAGVNCDHETGHHCGGDTSCGCDSCGDGEACDCGDGECGSCGGGCGGCGSMDPEDMPIIHEGKNAGKHVKTHYEGTLDDGTKFDSSYDRQDPLAFIAGVGMMIPGFDKAVVDMNVGDIVNIRIAPEDAYGMPDPAAIFTIDQKQLPGSEDLEVDQQVMLANQFGQPVPVRVVAKTEDTITFDANHELAGKALNFKIELVEVIDL